MKCTLLLILAVLSLVLTGCGRDYTAEVREFADGYLSTLFSEHARHRANRLRRMCYTERKRRKI